MDGRRIACVRRKDLWLRRHCNAPDSCLQWIQMGQELHTAGAASSGFRLRLAKRVLLVAASLASAYAIALATFMIRWMHFWIRGPYFLPYLMVFLTALALLLLWWTSRHHNRPLPVVSTVGYSVVA